jgi:hypothetical protein
MVANLWRKAAFAPYDPPFNRSRRGAPATSERSRAKPLLPSVALAQNGMPNDCIEFQSHRLVSRF